MDMDFADKVVVITGGSKGIGLAVATSMAAAGARVVVGARGSSSALERLTERPEVSAVAVDLSTADGAEQLVGAAVEQHGGIDVLVNNVGASEPGTSVLSFSDQQWQRVFDITLFSSVRMVRAAVPAMLGRRDASIVTISSLNARLPAGMIAPYGAAKAALTNLGTAWSDELAPQGIRVNTVSPGPVRTPLWMGPGGFAHLLGEAAGTTAEDFMDRVLPEAMSLSTGRVSEPDEVADLVLFLASNRAANITGADYVIDGGMLKTAS